MAKDVAYLAQIDWKPWVKYPGGLYIKLPEHFGDKSIFDIKEILEKNPDNKNIEFIPTIASPTDKQYRIKD